MHSLISVLEASNWNSPFHQQSLMSPVFFLHVWKQNKLLNQIAKEIPMFANGYVFAWHVLFQTLQSSQFVFTSNNSFTILTNSNYISTNQLTRLRVEAVRSVDQKYHVSVKAKSDASATGKSVAAAANTVINIFVYLF